MLQTHPNKGFHSISPLLQAWYNSKNFEAIIREIVHPVEMK